MRSTFRLAAALLLVPAAATLEGCGPVCGPGTAEKNGTCEPNCGAGAHADAATLLCVADVVCGDGTTALEGKCVVALPITCAAGTHLVGANCLPDEVCGAGTHASGGSCVPDTVCAAGTQAVDGGCVPAATACTAGTHLDAGTGKCVADVTCGPGTKVDAGKCIPECASGTIMSGTACVPNCATGTHIDNATHRCVGDVECGAGTSAQGGECLPTSVMTCGTGSHLVGSDCVADAVCGAHTHPSGGQCVPDAPACGAGTHLDQATSSCRADVVCGTGTEQRGGECLVLDTSVTATVPEGAEPNNDTAVRFTLPAVDGATEILGGTIDASTDGTADSDLFVFAATAGQVVHVSATALGAPEIAVIVAPAANPEGLPRYVRSLSSRTAVRDLVLPATGDWTLRVVEPANLRTGPVRGGPSFTYFVKVTQVAAPAHSQLAGGAGSGTYAATGVYDLAGGTGTTLARLTLNPLPAFAGLRALWAYDTQGKLVLAATDTESASGTLARMASVQFLSVPAGGLVLGVDHVRADGALDTAWDFTFEPIVPTDATLPYEKLDGDLSTGGPDIYAFDVTENSVLQAAVPDMGYDVTARLEVRDPSFTLVSSHESSYIAKAGAYVGPGAGGRWYVVVRNVQTGTATDTEYELTIAATAVVALTDLAIGASVTATATAVASEPNWFSLHVLADSDVTLEATPATGMRVDLAVAGLDLKQLGSQTGTTGSVTRIRGIAGTAGQRLLVSATANQAGSFSIGAKAQAIVPAVEVEPNDSATDATAVTLATTSTLAVSATLSSATDADWYSFTIAGSAAVTLVAATSPGPANDTPDTMVWLYDSTGTGTDIAHDDDGGPGLWSLLQKTGLQPGAYTLKVAKAQYGSATAIGQYVLMLSIEAP